MRAKDVEFDVTYIDLRDKPDWFLKISPHGKVPVLQVDEQPLFESNAIAEYLDEIVPPQLHPTDPIKRARNRAWTDFVPTFAAGLSGLYYTQTEDGREERMDVARQRLARLENAIDQERGNEGPYWNGDQLSLVDAAYAPFFGRFLLVEPWLKTELLDEYPNVRRWADALASSEPVRASLPDGFEEVFFGNLEKRGIAIPGRGSAPPL